MTLLEMSFTGAVLIAAVLILRALLLNRLPKRTFAALWGVAILRLLLPFSVASALSVYALFPAPVTEPAAVTSPDFLGKGAPDGAAVVPPISSAPGASPEREVLPVTGGAAEDETVDAPAPAPVSVETVLFFVWLGGASLMAGGFTFAYLRERRRFVGAIPLQNELIEERRRALGIVRRITLARSDRVAVPLTYGVLRPTILLPDSLDLSDEKRLGYVLEHELIHIRRLDALKKLLCALALSLHWFNPLVWVMFYYYERDLELACDEAVVRRLGEEKRSDYARALIGLAAERSGFRPFYSRFGGPAIEERIKALMKIKKKTFTAGAAACLLVLATAGVFTTSASEQDRESGTPSLKEKERIIVAAEEALNGGAVDETKWWTAAEFEEWIAEQKKEMEALIGTGSGWYDGEGVFHLFTEESMESALALYEETLADIKNGVLYSKDLGDGVQIVTFPGGDKEAEEAAYAEASEELERRLKPYRAFGVFVEEGTGEPRIVYGTRTVRSLMDEETGDYFTLHTGLWDYGEDAIDLYAVYNDGVLTGVREATAEEYAEADRLRRESSEKAKEIEERLKEAETVYQDSLIIGSEASGGETTVYAGDWTWTSPYAPVESAYALVDSALLDEYRPFGLEKGENGALTWNGKLVRWFIDGADLDGEGALATRYTYHNEDGTVDLRTVWEKKDNGDGSYDPFGTLVAIEEVKDLNPAYLFPGGAVDAVTVAEKDILKSGTASIAIEATAAEGNSAVGGGKTFAEIFAKYAPFGIVYDESAGNVYLNDRLVGTFVDLTETGVFSYQSRNADRLPTIDVRTVYDGGELVVIRQMTETERNAGIVEE
ncbi:MAG: hypothetical protein NC237_07315 [Eubacterium sp.]|nr:hypothetical protein [Eubacterium sp.]